MSEDRDDLVRACLDDLKDLELALYAFTIPGDPLDRHIVERIVRTALCVADQWQGAPVSKAAGDRKK